MKQTHLTITSDTKDDVTIFHLAGALDGHSFQQLEEKLSTLLDEDCPRLILVLTELNYIASAGVGLIINFFQESKKKNGGLALVKPSKVVQEIFNILGLEAIITNHESIDDGIEAVIG